MSVNAGTKFDAGKRRLSLFPLTALWSIIDVLEYGATKYTRVVASTPLDALGLIGETCTCRNAVHQPHVPSWAGVTAVLVQHKTNCAVQSLSVVDEALERTGAGNWRNVPDARTRYYDAANRHLQAWWSGEANDPESGLPHLAHAGCCVAFLLALNDTKGG